MKKSYAIALGAVVLFAGCNENLEVTPEIQKNGVYATIQQPEAPVSVKSLDWNANKFNFTWSEGENVVVFGGSDKATFSTLTAGSETSEIQSTGFKLQDGVDYYACIPYGFGSSSSLEAVPVKLMGQIQSANNNTDHLKDYNYACAAATKVEGSNSLSFNLKNQVSWIVLEHTFTEAQNVLSFNIATDEAVFPVEGTMNVKTSTFTPTKKQSVISLQVGDKNNNSGLSLKAGETFRGFITIAPVDLTGKTLLISASLSDGNSIELGTITAKGAISANKPVIICTSGSSTSAVATLDGVEYASIKLAMAAAKDGDVITLKKDATTEKVAIDKSVTIDLNGYTLTNDTDDVFKVTKDDLTVVFKNGDIVSNKYGVLFFNKGLKNENITFDNCNVTGVEGAIATSTLTGSTITINSGTYISSNNAVILTDENSREGEPNTIVINGGTFKGQMSDEAYTERNAIACGIYAAWKDNIIVNDGTFDIERGVGVLCRGGKVTINGGMFTTTDPDKKTGCVGDSRVVVPCQTVYVDKASQYPDYENATVEIFGGKFSDDSCKDYLADGYGIGEVFVETKEAWYTEVSEAVLEYDGVRYASLQTAIEASCDATKEITILKDMEVSQLTVRSENKVTINLNGKNVNITGYKVDCTGVDIDGGSLTIKGSGSFGDSAQRNVNPLFYVSKGASLTIEGDASYYSANVCAYARYWDSVIYINGGKWYGSETYTLNKHDDNQEAIISVTGGEFYKYNPAASHSENPVANFVADGYGVIKNGDWYKVVKATEVTDEASLKSANTTGASIFVNESIVLTEKNLSMSDNTSLYVGKDATLSSEFSGSYYMTLSYLNKGGVICGEGTIVAPNKKNAYTTAVQFDSRNKELVIDGNLTIKGGKSGVYNGDEYNEGISPAVFLYDGKLTIKGGHFIGGIDSKTGNASPTIYVWSNFINNNAELVINEGVFESATDDATFLINMDDDNKGKASIQIMGGTFVGFNPADNTADGEHTNYVADGYVSTQTTYNGKTAWVVSKAK